MLSRAWVPIAILLALGATIVVYTLLSALPPDTPIPLPFLGLSWAPTLANRAFVSIASFAGLTGLLILVQILVLGIWNGLIQIAMLVLALLFRLDPDGPPTKGLAALLAFAVAAGLVSSIVQNAYAIIAFILACLLSAIAFVLSRTFYELGEMRDRLVVRTRSSAIGGGQTEWQISRGLALILLAVILATGTVTLAALAIRPAAPTGGGEMAVPPKPAPAPATSPAIEHERS